MIFDNHDYLMVLLKRVYLMLIGTIAFVSILAMFFAYNWYKTNKEVKSQIYILEGGQTWAVKGYKMTPEARKKEVETFVRWILEKAFVHTKTTQKDNLREALNLMDTKSAEIIFAINKKDEMRFFKDSATSNIRIEKLTIEKGGDQNSLDGERQVAVRFYRDLHTWILDSEENYDKVEARLCALFFVIEDTPRTPANPWGLIIRAIQEMDPNLK